MSRIERAAPFLDEGVSLVQQGGYCYIEDPKFLARPWAVLSIEYVDDIAPTGWFWLNENIGNRKTIADCMKENILEVDKFPRYLSDGFPARIARVLR